jgi:hypothetical protein
LLISITERKILEYRKKRKHLELRAKLRRGELGERMEQRIKKLREVGN